MERADPAIKESMLAAGTEMVPQLAWAKTKSADGTSYSVLLKPEKQEEVENIWEDIRDRLNEIEPLPEIKAPVLPHPGFANVIPIFDAHLGMRADKELSGEDYNLNIATQKLRSRAREVLERMPKAAITYIVNGGDFTHADDDTNLTPKHKHPLDVDSRHYKTIDASVEVLSELIETALQHSEKVELHSIPGNHDPKTWFVTVFALAERFRDNPRVRIEKNPVEFFAFKWGKNLICGHHGDKRAAKDLVMFFASEYPEMWGETEHRYMFTGHHHRLKAEDFPGMKWECVRPFCHRDYFAASHAYPDNSELQGITFDASIGEISRVKVSGRVTGFDG